MSGFGGEKRGAGEGEEGRGRGKGKRKGGVGRTCEFKKHEYVPFPSGGGTCDVTRPCRNFGASAPEMERRARSVRRARPFGGGGGGGGGVGGWALL